MSALVDRVKQWVTDLTHRFPLIGLATDAISHFNAHEAMARSAAIAYYSILSLFPFAMMALVAASLLIGTGAELDAFVVNISQAFDLDPTTVSATLDSLIGARNGLALIAIGLLVISLLPWVSAVQRGIVRAFDEDRRSYVRTTLSSLLLLGLAAILILLSGVWGSLLGFIGGLISRLLPEVALVDVTVSLVLRLLPTAVVFLVMTALLRAVPAKNPTFSEVWLGASVTALGFLGLSAVFDIYVNLFVADSGNAAGPFGAILVGLLYIDFLAIALLAGAEVAGATVRRRRAPAAPAEPSPE
jgi:YihY family inner membrane protein